MTPLKARQIMTEEDYYNKVEEYGDEFRAEMGAEGVRELLRAINIDEQVETLRTELKNTGSEAKIKKYAKRLKVLEAALGHQARVDDPRSAAGAAAGTASARAAGRRPFRDVGPERPVSPRDQP